MAAIPFAFNLDDKISDCISGLGNLDVLEHDTTSNGIKIKLSTRFKCSKCFTTVLCMVSCEFQQLI